MNRHEGMVRVESAVSATASGNLTYEQWPYDVSTALGLSGQRNPLGFAVVRYLSGGPSSAAAWDVVLHLATALGNEGHESKLAHDAAWAALTTWNSIKCPHCQGTGCIGAAGKNRATCRHCNGTGERSTLSLPDIVRAGLGLLQESEMWMERQLAGKLRNGG